MIVTSSSLTQVQLRSNYEVVSLIPFSWKPKPVYQQTYTTNINPSYQDILRRNDYPHPDQAIDLTSISSPDTTVESADTPASESAQTNFSELSTVDFPVSDSDLFDPRKDNNHSNPDSTSAELVTTSSYSSLPDPYKVTLQYVLSTYCRSLRPFHS